MAHLEHDPNKRPDRLRLDDLSHVAPMHASVNPSGHMTIADVDLVELASELGTALYVMDEAALRHQLRAYQDAFDQGWADYAVAYAAKAFICKAMCRLVDEEGGWLDVSSGGELAIALAADFPTERIIMHGNNKTERELVEAVTVGVGRIVVDCFEELQRLQQICEGQGLIQKIQLRIKPGVVPDTHSHIVTGNEDSKFGFGIADGWAMQAVALALAANNLELCGLHAHIGSQIFNYAAYDDTVNALFALIQKSQAELGYTPSELNLGGGVGAAYLHEQEPPSIEGFVQLILEVIAQKCDDFNVEKTAMRLFIEPGRSIVANAGVTLYTVGAVKDLPGVRTYVAVDGGMSDNIRTALYDARYECLIANRANDARDAIVTVAGKHCESGDVLVIDGSIQEPQVGDILVVLTTGAYNQSMASNYNKQPRPAVVWLADGQAREVVRRETYEDLLACEVG
ncbi:MAG: diaminopimelate decarboxylase [Coriobacteriia bacterium]|nr:diaminopimelate decarboxylase [Coriobacteriia bacterium]